MRCKVNAGSPSVYKASRDFEFFDLPGGVTRSQTRRDTNFAIPGYSLFCHDTTANGKNKVFSVCGHSCGQSHFYAVFCNRGKSCKRMCHKALRHFALPCPGYRHGTPKPRALPSELHPVMKLISCAVCSQPCGQRGIFGRFRKMRKTRRCRRCKALRRFASPYPGYRHGTPKAGAIPSSLYPVVRFRRDIIPNTTAPCKVFRIDVFSSL